MTSSSAQPRFKASSLVIGRNISLANRSAV
jgi:hypothetical protein